MALHHARVRPSAIAFSWIEDEVTFQRLEKDVVAVSAALTRLHELSPKLVAVRYASSYRHWVILLALARMGLASASLPIDYNANFKEALTLLAPDIILLDDDQSITTHQCLVLDERWFERVVSNVMTAPRSAISRPDDIARVMLTGGTSAKKKTVALSYRYIENSIYHLLYQDVVSGKTQNADYQLLSVIGPETPVGYLLVLAALTAGSTVQAVRPDQFGLVLSQRRPTTAIVTPSHLNFLLKQIPPSLKRMDNLYLTVIAAKLSRTLYEQTEKLLTPHVYVAYGADECGAVTYAAASTLSSESNVGHLLPWVQLEIIGKDDSPLQTKQAGIVRLRGTGIVDGYLNDADATAAQFRDGWFYPGDRGYMDEDGALHLVGRVDDVVSFGGDKFDLQSLDQRIKACPGVVDAAMFVVPNDIGGAAPWVAIIVTGEFSTDTLSAWIRETNPNLPAVTVVWVDTIPRLPDYSIDRDNLTKLALSQRH